MSIIQAIGCFLGLHDPPEFYDQYDACRRCPHCGVFERNGGLGLNWYDPGAALEFKPFEWWELKTQFLKHLARAGYVVAVIDDQDEVHYLTYRRFGRPRDNQGHWEDACL